MIVFEILGGIFLLGLGFLLFAIWRFSAGPVDMTFAADYVRSALRSESQVYDITFDSIVADWPEFDGPLLFGMSGFKILENGKETLSIDSVGLRVAKAPLLIGLISPEAVILTRPAVKVIRGEDKTYRLLVTDQEDAAVSGDPSVPPPSLKDIGESFFLGGSLPASPLAALSNLEKFVIRDARLIAEDRGAGVTWVLPQVSAELSRQKNLFDLNIEYVSPGRKAPTRISAHLERERRSGGIDFGLDFGGVDLALPLRHFVDMPEIEHQRLFLDGKVSGTLNDDWQVQTVDGALGAEKGRINLGEKRGGDLVFRNLSANVLYDREFGKFLVRDTKIEVGDLSVGIEAERKVDGDGKEVFPVRLSIPEVTLGRIHSLWPEEARDTILADWITRRLVQGTLKDLEVGFTVDLSRSDYVDSEKIDAAFAFENLTCDYNAPLTPASEASGNATIKDDILDVLVTKGKIGSLNVNGGEVKITNLTKVAPGDVTINVAANGDFSEALRYIALEPIGLGKRAGLEPEKVKGSVDMNVNVTFPALKDLLKDQVTVVVDATLNDVLLPGIVRGLDVSGGPLKLAVKGGAITVSGKGFLNGNPMDMTYSEYIDSKTAPYLSDVKAKVLADLKLRDHFGVHIEQFVEGNVGIDLHYRQPDSDTETTDLALDLTPARVKVDPLAYEKAPGVKGSATCSALVRKGEIQEIKNLNVAIGADKATQGLLKFGMIGGIRDVKTGTFSEVRLGDDNNFSLGFERVAKDAISLTLKGRSLDGRTFLSSKNKNAKQASPSSADKVSVEASFARMRTGDEPDQYLLNPVIDISQMPDGKFLSLNVRAMAGDGPLDLSLRPDASGKMHLKIDAADAGNALRILDVYDRMVGGSFTFEGTQIPGGGINDIHGTAEIRDFRIVKAPVLAQLINAFSVTGLLEALQNNGIAFTKLKSDFIWKKTANGRVIDLFDGRTSGASVGLTFGGRIDQGAGTMDLSGTVSPMSEVNKIVGSIPLIGNLLTGGSGGGIIAATYSVKGDSEDPKVVVNPLSVLAPGFLRAILFEEDTKYPPKDSVPVPKKGLNR
jgi:hypothetical protein